MSTITHAPSPAALAAAEINGIYRRLCEKAKRVHSRDDDASTALFGLVCALQDEWTFGQDFRVQETKHLDPEDRTDFLRIVAYIVNGAYWPSSFAAIARDTIGEL